MEPKTINDRSALNKFDNEGLSPKELFVHIYNETIDELYEICRDTLKVTGKDREIF